MIESATSFADRFMLTNIRNTLKYDHRTRESKKAWAKLRLMLATATDDDLKELAELQHKPLGDSTLDEKLESLIKTLVTFFILVSVLEEVYPRESEYA